MQGLRDQAMLAGNFAGVFVSATGSSGSLDLGLIPTGRVFGPLSNLTVTNITADGLWSLPFAHFVVNGVVRPTNSNITLALNSAFNLMPNFTSVVDLFQQVFPTITRSYATLGNLSVITVPSAACAASVVSSITMNIGGVNFNAGRSLIQLSSSTGCYFAFASIQNNVIAPFGTEYTLGYSFLRTYYAIFNYTQNVLSLGTHT